MKPHVEVAMAAPFRRNGEVIEFLIIRRVPDDGGFWQPVTGGIEEGELPRETAIREMAEEAGIFDLLHMSEVLHHNEWEMDDHTGRDHVHAAEVPLETQVILSKEHDDYRWLPLEDAVEFLKFDGNKESLRLVHAYALKLASLR